MNDHGAHVAAWIDHHRERFRRGFASRIGTLPPLRVRLNRRTGKAEFVALHGTGAGRATPPPLPALTEYLTRLAATLGAVRRILNRPKGSAAVKRKADERRDAIRVFALSFGWPARGATKATIAYFALIDGEAPKHLRCSRRTVMTALAGLPRPEKGATARRP